MVTMNDIARKAGVGQSTVSYVLNDKHDKVGISEETRLRILATARELGYRPNQLARAMVTGRNSVLGFLACYPGYEQVGYMLLGALEEADRHGYSIKVISCNENGIDRSVLDRCAELQLAGVLALHLPGEMMGALGKEMTLRGAPTVVLDTNPGEGTLPCVLSDDDAGVAAAVAHLVELGHSRIAFLSVEGDGVAAMREAAFARVMKKLGLELPTTYRASVKGYWNDEEVEEATRKLLGHTLPPTALLCAGDAMAMVAMRTARAHGVPAPEQLSVIGFSDLAMAARSDPPLTTVRQPFREMGEQAARYLLEILESEQTGARDKKSQKGVKNGQVHWMPTSLVRRQSTASPCT